MKHLRKFENNNLDMEDLRYFCALLTDIGFGYRLSKDLRHNRNFEPEYFLTISLTKNISESDKIEDVTSEYNDLISECLQRIGEKYTINGYSSGCSKVRGNSGFNRFWIEIGIRLTKEQYNKVFK